MPWGSLWEKGTLSVSQGALVPPPGEAQGYEDCHGGPNSRLHTGDHLSHPESKGTPPRGILHRYLS
jgi:hypothetical protein